MLRSVVGTLVAPQVEKFVFQHALKTTPEELLRGSARQPLAPRRTAVDRPRDRPRVLLLQQPHGTLRLDAQRRQQSSNDTLRASLVPVPAPPPGRRALRVCTMETRSGRQPHSTVSPRRLQVPSCSRLEHRTVGRLTTGGYAQACHLRMADARWLPPSTSTKMCRRCDILLTSHCIWTSKHVKVMILCGKNSAHLIFRHFASSRTYLAHIAAYGSSSTHAAKQPSSQNPSLGLHSS